MLDVFESLLPVFLVIALGVFLKQIRFISDEAWQGMEKVAFWVMFPALLVESIVRADLAGTGASRLASTLIMSVLTFGLIVWLLRKPLQRMLHMNGPSYTSFFQGATRWNAFIALAVVVRLYGQEGLTLMAVALGSMIPVLQVTNVLILSAYAAAEPPSWSRLARTLVRNPLLWACIVGMAINLLGIPVYEPLLTAANVIGRGGLGVGLLVVGAGLVVRDVLRPGAAVLVATLFKFALFPALASAVCFAFGLSGLEFYVAMLAAAMPTATNGYILARQMGGDAPLLASIVTFQTAVAIVTVPLTMWLVS